MKISLNSYEVADRLMEDQYAGWSRPGAQALAEYLEELEADMGEEMELDVCAIRCDFSEYESLVDWAEDYFSDWKEELDIEEDMDEDEINDIIREYIHNHGILIEFDGGIIVSSF